MGYYIWYSEKGTGRGRSPPRPLLAVPNVTVHPSAVSVPITVLLYNDGLLCGFNVPIKGLTGSRISLVCFSIISNSFWLLLRHEKRFNNQCKACVGHWTSQREVILSIYNTHNCTPPGTTVAGVGDKTMTSYTYVWRTTIEPISAVHRVTADERILSVLSRRTVFSSFFFFLSFLFGVTVTHAPFSCQRWGLPHRLAQCATRGKGHLMVCVVCSCCATSPYREVCRAKGGIGSGETLCHDIYPARPITTVSLATNTYVGPRVQFSGACEQSHWWPARHISGSSSD